MSFLTSNIKYLRVSSGLNQAEFGNLFGCSRDNIASYERGTEPKLEMLFKIVNYFHITLDDIYTKDLEKNAHLNAHPNAHLPDEKNPLKEKVEFKQSLKTDNPPGCQQCLEKDKMLHEQENKIKELHRAISNQADYIDSLKEKIEELTGRDNGGQKRKAS